MHIDHQCTCLSVEHSELDRNYASSVCDWLYSTWCDHMAVEVYKVMWAGRKSVYVASARVWKPYILQLLCSAGWLVLFMGMECLCMHCCSPEGGESLFSCCMWGWLFLNDHFHTDESWRPSLPWNLCYFCCCLRAACKVFSPEVVWAHHL